MDKNTKRRNIQSLMMIITAIALLLPKFGEGRSICNTMGGCYICYNSVQLGGRLTECSYQVCEETETTTYFDSSTNTTKTEQTCIRYGTRYHNETSCLRSCCGQITKVDYFSIEQLNKCQSYYRLLPAVIIGGILYSIAFIAFAIIFMVNENSQLGRAGQKIAMVLCFPCFAFYDKWWVTRGERRERKKEAKENQEMETIEHRLNLQWEEDVDGHSEADLVIEDQSYFCPICSKSGVNTMSSRTVFYHLECICEWLKNNEQEPNSTQSMPTKYIRYYCSKCRKKYCELTVEQVKETPSQICKIIQKMGQCCQQNT